MRRFPLLSWKDSTRGLKHASSLSEEIFSHAGGKVTSGPVIYNAEVMAKTSSKVVVASCQRVGLKGSDYDSYNLFLEIKMEANSFIINPYS